MKMKMKKLAFVGIVVLLCSLFLVALPTIAAEDDYVLGIYGNANEDDTIDMRDLTYVKLIFFGKKPETELADAKYDGKINPLDFIQIKLIIVGKEKELTLVDSADRIVTVKKPLRKIVPASKYFVETMRSLKLEKDRIVGVTGYVIEDEIFFPEFSDYPSIGKWPVDVEKILSLTPDAVFLFAYGGQDDEREKLEDAGITVLCFDLYLIENIYVEETKKLGYILDKEKEAEEFLEFYEGYLNTIKKKVEEIPEDERPRVYFENYYRDYTTGGKGKSLHRLTEMAGGNNIFGDLSGYFDVDPEEVAMLNPEIIVKAKRGYGALSGYDTADVTAFKEVWDKIMARPELKEVSAVKNERVYVVWRDIYYGPRHFMCSIYMAKWFHPHLFEELDPKVIHQEYLTDFQELDIDLDKHGVTVYHPEDHPDGK